MNKKFFMLSLLAGGVLLLSGATQASTRATTPTPPPAPAPTHPALDTTSCMPSNPCAIPLYFACYNGETLNGIPTQWKLDVAGGCSLTFSTSNPFAQDLSTGTYTCTGTCNTGPGQTRQVEIKVNTGVTYSNPLQARRTR